MSELSGWGRYPVVDGVERVSEDFEVATAGAALSRGLGRSYGDASLPSSPGDVVANSRRADRLVASDVHGGNHHVAGTFGEHVHGLRMRVADGRVLEVSERSEPELFRATLG